MALIGGCSSGTLSAGTAKPSELTRTGSLKVSPTIVSGAFRSQSVINNYYTRESVYHLVVQMFLLSGGTENALVDENGQPLVVDIPKDKLSDSVTFSSVPIQKPLRIRCFAYKGRGTAPSQLISTRDERSYLDVELSDDATSIASLKVQLVDVLLTGDATMSTEQSKYGEVSTLAGGASSGFAEGLGQDALFAAPAGLAADHAGNVYVADAYNHRIRKITPDGQVTTVAGGSQGFADGDKSIARFQSPFGVAIDDMGTIYVADTFNSRIRKITPDGRVSTLAGGSVAGYADGVGTQARFNHPFGIAVDGNGAVFVADSWNHRIRKVSPAGVVTTIAGNGTAGFFEGSPRAIECPFNTPCGVALDSSGNVYVADTGNHVIRVINYQYGDVDPDSGQFYPFTGRKAGNTLPGFADGPWLVTQFNHPWGIALDANNNVYVADTSNHRIRMLHPDGSSETLAGNGDSEERDGLANFARFSAPAGLTLLGNDTLYISDLYGNAIRSILIH